MLETYVKLEAWYQNNIIGKRTYIIAAVGAIVNLLMAFGVVTADSHAILTVNSILAFAGIGTLRASVK